MKLAVAACVAICLSLGSLALRAASGAGRRDQPAQPAARAAHPAIEKRALADIDKRLARKLRRLAAGR